MTSSAEEISVVENRQSDKTKLLPILNAIHEGEQMDELELELESNPDDDNLEDPMASGRCSSALPPPIKGGKEANVNLSSTLSAALHSVNNPNYLPTVDTQKPATEVELSLGYTITLIIHFYRLFYCFI